MTGTGQSIYFPKDATCVDFAYRIHSDVGDKTVGATKDYDGKNVFGTDQYSDTDEHYLRRNGNIGVTTTQQMLESEIELWQWNFINDYVFKCADKLLTLPIY